ncbi:MAG: phosphatidylserine/phosphatidylglycerophosphate/cardiolipin synthase family protein [Cyanobacteriota bacterium]|nr:phosphatidylserine/phosphatidylglycerophosphate/cardiolipin synthase family protein [Cyanobacteriota bacterium]
MARCRWGALLLLLPIAWGSLGGCGSAPARLEGARERPLPLPAGIRVAFNHREGPRYRSPVSGRWRQGDDLEALVVEAIGEARSEILVAVQELSLPGVAEALIARHREGVAVRVVLENTYSAPWSRLHPVDLTPHQRLRQAQLEALGQPDAVALLESAGVPLLDDTADGSAGSGLMHHKFLVVDRQVVVTGSANFSPSCVHGDADDPRTRGNVNHLLRFDSPELAELFAREFERLWGDGPDGALDSRFGLAKESGPVRRVRVGDTLVEVLFAPHRRADPNHGLAWLAEQLVTAERALDLSLFVFSAQNLADALAALPERGVAVRLLADPGFASRPFSEVLDVLGVSRADGACRLEADNRVWRRPLEGVGTPRLVGGDKLHHKFAVIDGERVITGSFNWSPSAAHQNDETLLLIHSPELAAHFNREMDRLWRGAELGVSGRIERALARSRQRCGRGRPRPSLLTMEEPAAAP